MTNFVPDSGKSTSRPAPFGERFAVRLVVEGRDVPLKSFLHDLIGGAALGLIGGLRGVDDPSTVTIEVRRLLD